MTDETESRARTERLGRQDWTAEKEIRGETGRTGKLEPVGPPVRLGVLEIRDETGRTVFRDETEYRAWLGRQDPAGPLVRRVRSARRVSRALRAILARLVRRANL